MDIKVYGTEGCFYCDQLKELFRRADLSYDLTMIVDDINNKSSGVMHKDVFHEKYHLVSGFPYVIIDGDEIGGLVDTAKYLVANGLVSSSGAR